MHNKRVSTDDLRRNLSAILSDIRESGDTIYVIEYYDMPAYVLAPAAAYQELIYGRTVGVPHHTIDEEALKTPSVDRSQGDQYGSTYKRDN